MIDNPFSKTAACGRLFLLNERLLSLQPERARAWGELLLYTYLLYQPSCETWRGLI